MGDKGRAADKMAERLGLVPSGLPLRSSFDHASDYIAALGLLAGAAERIAHDVVFMQRTEIGEVEEAFYIGKVGSSTMAQKRNPSTALMLLSLCRLMRARVILAMGSMVRMDEGFPFPDAINQHPMVQDLSSGQTVNLDSATYTSASASLVNDYAARDKPIAPSQERPCKPCVALLNAQ